MNSVQLAILENIVTMIAACTAAYWIDPWCFLLLLNLNSVKRKVVS